MPTQTPILGLYNPLDPDDANTAVRVWRTADNAVLDAAVGTARQNLLTNGSFDIWQRGNGAFTANGAYTADRWVLALGAGSTCSITRSTTTVDTGSGASMAVTYTHAAQTIIQQKIEDVGGLRGRPITVQMRVNASAANAVRLLVSFQANAGSNTYSTYHPGGSAWQTLTVTVTVPANETGVFVNVLLEASCTAYLDNATLCVGTSALAYAPLHPADELARCLRYYEVHGGANVTYPFMAFSSNGASHAIAISPGFAVQKAVVPTITKNGTWGVANCGQPAVDGANRGGYRLYVITVAAGGGNAQPADATCTVVAEANV